MAPDNSYSSIPLIFSTICIKLPASDTGFAQSRGFYIMTPIIRALLAFAVSLVRSRASLQVEILALQHQLAVYHRSIRRPRVCPSDRLFWSWLARGWTRWREVVVFVPPATGLAWQRKRFRDHWARLSRREPGRPAITKEVRELIREVSGQIRGGVPHAFRGSCGNWALRWRNPPSRSIACARDGRPRPLGEPSSRNT